MRRLLDLLRGPRDRPVPRADGYGQSLADDLRSASRFRRARREPLLWRRPTPEEAAADRADLLLSRFGDDTVAKRDGEGRRWTVLENDWHGWPDPPRYALFAMEGDRVWMAANFDRWPRRWTFDDGGGPP